MWSRHRLALGAWTALVVLILLVIVIERFVLDEPPNEATKDPAAETPLDSAEVLLSYLLKDLDRRHGSGDIFTYTNKLRLYKKLRTAKGTSLLSPRFDLAYRSLHDHLFKWALKRHRTVEEMQRSYSGRGIVICAGGKYVKLAVHAIKAIRLLGCNLPVEIFFNGSEDMNTKQHDYLRGMNNVAVFDIQEFVDAHELGLKTWDIKPFSLLLCSFAEAILMDADTIFVHSPSLLFDDPGYVSTGTAFFYDRTLFGFNPQNATAWFDAILPAPLSDTVLASRMYNRTTNYEQEAGVVLVDKSRRLLGMLATCRLNFPDFKEQLHKFTHGDKESFWLGMEMAAEPYYFIPSMAGSIGHFKANDKGEKRICGKAAHFDRDERLFWFNDGMVENKHAQHSDPSDLQFYGIEGKWDVLCLVCDPRPLDAGSKTNIQRILGSFERDPLEMSDPQDGAAMFLLGRYQ